MKGLWRNKSQTLENTGSYFAGHMFYQYTATEREESILNSITYNQYFNSYNYKKNVYTVDRNIFSLNIKLGYQGITKSGLTIDSSIGFGGQYITSHSKNKLGTDSFKDLPWNKLFDSGSGLYPKIVYQLRLGWAF